MEGRVRAKAGDSIRSLRYAWNGSFTQRIKMLQMFGDWAVVESIQSSNRCEELA